MRPLRLLVDAAASGPWNMAVDEVLLAAARSSGRATLRLYRWSGPWLSLGYAQRPEPARLAACAEAGVGVVRRVTGGRAVLHGADLTYALAAPAARLPAGLAGSYARVADALLAALASIGVTAERERGGGGPGGFDCFAGRAAQEVLASGKKLVGSAQRRAGGALLQHGSIRLCGDAPAARAAAGLEPGSATSLAELGYGAGVEELSEACAKAFAEALGAVLEPGGLSPRELSLVRARSTDRARDALSAPPIP